MSIRNIATVESDRTKQIACAWIGPVCKREDVHGEGWEGRELLGEENCSREVMMREIVAQLEWPEERVKRRSFPDHGCVVRMGVNTMGEKGDCVEMYGSGEESDTDTVNLVSQQRED